MDAKESLKVMTLEEIREPEINLGDYSELSAAETPFIRGFTLYFARRNAKRYIRREARKAQVDLAVITRRSTIRCPILFLEEFFPQIAYSYSLYIKRTK
jgi:hypothetical protein